MAISVISVVIYKEYGMNSIIVEYKYKFNWSNNEKRRTLKNRLCRVLARGKKNSILIELEDGQKEVVSRYSIIINK